MLDSLRHDILVAVRSLGRQPVLVVSTVVLLGLGIGANSAIFTFVDALLLRTLPVRRPHELVRVVQIESAGSPVSYFPELFLTSIAARSRSVRDAFAWTDISVSFVASGIPEPVHAQAVSGNFFTALGVGTSLGRTLIQDDDGPGKPLVAVLSAGFWRRRFGADSRVLAQTIHLHGRPFAVIGVTSESFTGITIDSTPDVFVPLIAAPLLSTGAEPPVSGQMFLPIAGRLSAGFTRESARQELQGIYESVSQARANANQLRQDSQSNVRIDLEPFARGTSALRSQFSAAALMLLGGAGFLMVVVCANVAGLFLARLVARRREWAVRIAMGASWWRLAQAMLAESLLLAACGVIVGLGIATAATPFLLKFIPPIRDISASRLSSALQLHLDWRTLSLAGALGMLTALTVGLTSACRVSRDGSRPMLIMAGRVSKTGRLPSFLVVTQVVLSTLLLTCAALFWQTFQQLRNLDPGFDRDHIVTFSLDPALVDYTGAQSRALQRWLLDGVRGIPGVTGAAIASRGVIRGTGLKTTIVRLGERASRSDYANTSMNVVSPEYFATMGVRLLDGRMFRESETTKPQPVIVNQEFCRRFFPEGRAVGRMFGASGEKPAGPDYEIIGVVGDSRYRSLREPIAPIMYRPFRGDYPHADSFVLHVRTRVSPESVIGQVRSVLREWDAGLPFSEVRTLLDDVEDSLWRERLVAFLSIAFAFLSTLLAATGLYSLLSQFVVLRRHELGIRMALGARDADIFSLVLWRGFRLTFPGVVLGLAVSLVAVRSFRPLLYGSEALSWWSAIAVAASVLLVALVAGAGPAWRAVRLDPAETLRAE